MERTSEKWICVNRGFKTKLAISLVCLMNCTWHIGFYQGCPIENHLIYSFFHVNGFHLAVNLMVLWSIKNRIRPISSLMIAIIASFLPMYVSEPTMGLSGFLFASFGQMWGKTERWKEAIIKVMPFIVFTMILSNTNGLLHLWCFLLGFSVQYITTKATAHHE